MNFVTGNNNNNNTMKQNRWFAHEQTRNLLELNKVDFTTETISIGDIDRELGLRNQAREVPLDHDTVESYAQAMREGSPFPCVVLCRTRKSIYPIGGNHRIAAAEKAGVTEIMAFVVEINDDALMQCLPKILNTVEGRRPSLQELKLGAHDMVKAYGWSLDQAAKNFNISRTVLGNYIRADEEKRKLVKLGIQQPGRLSDPKLIAIGAVQSEPVKRALAQLANDGNISVEEIRATVKKFKAGGTELDHCQTINEKRKLLGLDSPSGQAGKRSIRCSSKLAEWKRVQTTYERILDGVKSLKQLGITESERTESVKRLKDLLEKIQSILRK